MQYKDHLKMIEAMLLLVSYYEAAIKHNVSYLDYIDNHLFDCPLCEVTEGSCDLCPWMLITGGCCSCDYETRSSNDNVLKQERIDQLHQWIEEYQSDYDEGE